MTQREYFITSQGILIRRHPKGVWYRVDGLPTEGVIVDEYQTGDPCYMRDEDMAELIDGTYLEVRHVANTPGEPYLLSCPHCRGLEAFNWNGLIVAHPQLAYELGLVMCGMLLERGMKQFIDWPTRCTCKEGR